jgi:capsular exopolysaccharide synthesis family protein
MNQMEKALEKEEAARLGEGARDVSGTMESVIAREAPGNVEPARLRGSQSAPGELLERRVVAFSDEHTATDQFKLLRTRLFQHTRPMRRSIVQITGFNTNEGISLVAVNLAISMSRDIRQNTLLVDLDFRRPSLHQLLGLDASVEGLRSHFLEGKPLEDLFVNPGIPGLSVLPAGGRIPQSTEILGSPAMEALLQQLRERFPDHYIVLDTPGIHACPDAVVVSEYVDAIVLVARAGMTPQELIRTGIQRLPGEKIVGMVLNDAPAAEASPGAVSSGT